MAAGAATHRTSIPFRLLHSYLRWLPGHLTLSDPTQTAGVLASFDGSDILHYITHTKPYTADTSDNTDTYWCIVYLYLFKEVIGSK